MMCVVAMYILISADNDGKLLIVRFVEPIIILLLTAGVANVVLFCARPNLKICAGDECGVVDVRDWIIKSAARFGGPGAGADATLAYVGAVDDVGAGVPAASSSSSLSLNLLKLASC